MLLALVPPLCFLLLASSLLAAPGRNYNLAFQKSVVNQGDERLLHNVFAKLARGECLNVLAVGGSITCAVSLPDNQHGWFYPDAAHNNRTNAWPAFLQSYLNAHFPCPLHGHRVINVCSGGFSSDIWADHFSGKNRYIGRDPLPWLGQGLNGSDLVIMDTAVNDVEELQRKAHAKGMEGSHAIQKATESLMLLIMHNMSAVNTSIAPPAGSITYPDLPSDITAAHAWTWSGIACIWLGTATRQIEWDGAWPRTGDSVHTHLPIAQRHGVPYVSMVDGFGPFSTFESRQWFLDVYRGDWCCHVSIQGHMLLAELLLDFMQTRYDDWSQRDMNRPWPHAGSNRHSPYELRKPLLLSSWDVVQLTGSDPLRMDMQGYKSAVPINTTRLPCTGFNFSDDGHNKPGLLAYELGSTCSFLVANDKIQKHTTFWQLHVKTLKSYNLMGTLDVQVSAVSCNTNEGIANPQPLGSMQVECLWEKRFSLSEVDRLDLKRPTDPASCLLILFRVVKSANATSNKIKVFDMELF